ncbi:hypothetical protein CEP54_013216 [Fusarium duplospermum]|uniref:DUF676 domain-containing protein n=1 Tax=Fusarium duplospermum TaxID=1325734 RepID=A0A428P456_9HYPO|nr:hypothetical protein CEP54_013216 [Fusarium duplospermum]
MADTEPFGLGEPLCDPPPQTTKADIVFVHGLDGHRDKTWTCQGTDDMDPVFWPRDLLPSDCQDARILSFGYNASVAHFFNSGNDKHPIAPTTTIDNHSVALLDSLKGLRARTNTTGRPIIFVAHSLGGLVCANAIAKQYGADTPEKALVDSVRGLIFLGTPFAGSKKASWALVITQFLRLFISINQKKLEDLDERSENLLKINDEFLKVIWARQRSDNPIQVAFYYEELPTIRHKVRLGFIVDTASAVPRGFTGVGIQENHSNMCKFSDAYRSGFISISSTLNQWIQDLDTAENQRKNVGGISVAQPLAYRTLTHESVNLVNLVRTLFNRPDLAAEVREFRQPLAGFCEGTAQELKLLSSVAHELHPFDGSEDITKFRRDSNQDVILEDVCVELIIAMSPNLETLGLYSPKKGTNHRNQYPLLYKRFRKVSKLPQLHHLELGRKDTIKMPFTRPSIDTALLLNGTFNLRQLLIRGVTNLHDSLFGQEQFGRMQPTLDSLRHIELQECALETRNWGEMFLSQLVAMAPNLEHFRYTSEEYRHPNPVARHLSVPHMLRALRTLDANLNIKFLDIHLGAFVRCKWPNRGNLISMTDFEEFPALQTLKLDENAICRCWDSPINMSMPQSATACLIETLPRRLQEFTLRVFRGTESHIWGDLVELAHSLYQFPSLERVVVQAISKRHNYIQWANFQDQVFEQKRSLEKVWSTTKPGPRWDN